MPDVLIIGSGPIGSTYARVLTEENPDLSILLVDAGPQLTSVPGVHVKNIAGIERRRRAQAMSQSEHADEAETARIIATEGKPPTPDTARPGTAYLDPSAAAAMPPTAMHAAAMSTCVGGMAAHWTGACPWPQGTEMPEFIDPQEWDTALERAQHILQVTQDAFATSPVGEAVCSALAKEFDAELPLDRRVQPMPLAVTVKPDGTLYWTGTDIVLDRLATDPPSTFELRSETLCRSLLVEEGRVTGARLKDLRTGETYSQEAKVVVVACDGIRTPQLLWASGIRPEALGRYLNDHTQVMAGVALDPEKVPGAYAANRVTDPLVGVHWVPYSEAHPYHGQLMQMDLSPIALADGAKDDGTQVIGMGYFVPKDISADDRLVFSETETDRFGLPQVHTEYTLTKKDHADIARVTAVQQRVADALGRFAPGREPMLMPPGSSLHYQGTFRMGVAEDGTSVCDPSCRVWGFDNLFVGGNGVIPTPTAGNPTLTSVAHAVRSALVIARSFGEA
ncbi:GMC oxidoreductase [Streptomyces mayonensis]|uniref:GMC oxidoreductase n=1 Tax=Streptomyces mayonensis TaxID=2750816 RepID=UPI001C1DE4A8|nr:GMC oxidoreductase [Streptomyces sp. A108]MBU6529626.1 GMC family oxidoreductase N-terminal domain-containing protein [Streptomyces sp. A108]